MQKLNLMNIKFIIRKNRESEGFVPIQMQITFEGKRLYLSTNQSVEPANWHTTTGRCLGKSSKHKIINDYLDQLKNQAFKSYSEILALGEELTPEEFKQRLTGKDRPQKKSLLEICDVFNSNAEKLVGIEIGKITHGRYLTFKGRLYDFLQAKYKVKDIYLSQLKYSFIVEYEFFLKTEIKLHQNTMVKYLQYLSRVCEFAVNHEWMDRNLFQNYKCPIKETKREYLTQDELNRIMDKSITIERLSEVRDVFVFCCYTGYAYKDAANLTPDHIGVGINSKKWIYTSRQKNDNVSNVPLLDQAMDIIEKYKDHPICRDKNKLLPMKSNQKLNAYLKELADICNITKPMTMHIARHTFATTVLLANGVSMEATSKMLGHSSLKTTQIYGKILETRVASEMEILSQKLSVTPKVKAKKVL